MACPLNVRVSRSPYVPASSSAGRCRVELGLKWAYKRLGRIHPLSKITWDSSSSLWDAGQKTFASARTADVFGFCGDAFFPPAILRQVTDQINAGLILPDGMDAVTGTPW